MGTKLGLFGVVGALSLMDTSITTVVWGETKASTLVDVRETGASTFCWETKGSTHVFGVTKQPHSALREDSAVVTSL